VQGYFKSYGLLQFPVVFASKLFLLLVLEFCGCFDRLQAQDYTGILDEIKLAHRKITNTPCTGDSALAISDRAMNVFMADKTAYVSESSDLSYFTNYLTLNTLTGRLGVNHNFQNTNGNSLRIRRLFSVGFFMNVANNIAPGLFDRNGEEEAGVSLNFKWLGKVTTRFADCSAQQNGAGQKQVMDLYREVLLKQLDKEVLTKISEFESNLTQAKKENSTPVNTNLIEDKLRKDFQEELQHAYEEKFATLQANYLTNSKNFKLIKTSWTSLTLNAPFVFPRYSVAESFSATIQARHSYTADLSLSHTRLWESSKLGRLFATLTGRVFINNSKLSQTVYRVSPTEYKSLGGRDTTRLTNLHNDKLYVGIYDRFISPAASLRCVYFPTDGHVGLSMLLEQHLGQYDPFNCRVGVPIVLINKQKTPAINFEFYVMFYDLTNKVILKNARGKTVIGLGMGVPMSRLMF
jgi:hypothetical protein